MIDKDNTTKPEILLCPFCGKAPVFPESKDVFGTCYDAGCNECGIATISMQIIDCFDYGEGHPNREDAHNSWDQDNIKYSEEIIEVARSEAISDWNHRA